MLSGESTGTGVPLEGSPFRDPGRDARGDLGKLAEHGTQGVDGVPAGDGQDVGAVGADALPDAAGAPLQLRLHHTGEVRREHLADVARLDEVTRVENRRRAARL
jgi:hypothetical protein